MLPIASAKSSHCYFLWQNASAGEAGEEKSIIRIFLAVRRGCEKWQLRALSLFIGHRKHSHQEHYTRASVEECPAMVSMQNFSQRKVSSVRLFPTCHLASGPVRAPSRRTIQLLLSYPHLNVRRPNSESLPSCKPLH